MPTESRGSDNLVTADSLRGPPRHPQLTSLPVSQFVIYLLTLSSLRLLLDLLKAMREAGIGHGKRQGEEATEADREIRA
eukprot:762820-Hanusia_phi.AAC.6